MKKEHCSVRLKQALKLRDMKQSELSQYSHVPKSAISQYVSGKFEPKQDRIELFAKILDVSEVWLMGYDVPISHQQINTSTKFPPPTATEDYVTFPVIGEIAAGYDSLALEEWEGDTIEIPKSYLKGRDSSEFFVLRVKGDSMYPVYMEDDKVLILKQATLNYSGQVGAVLYDGELATLKKVEFVSGEDWMRLIAINPNVPPKKIEGPELEHCKIMGVPKLLIRNIEG